MDTYSSYDSNALGIFAAIIGIFSIFIFIFAVVFYIFSALGFYTMAKNKGLDNPWLAWIPIGNMYLLGKILNDKIAVGSKVVNNASMVLLVGTAVISFASMVPFIGWLISIAWLVFTYMAFFRLFKLYKPESATLYLILSIVIAIVSPFLVFSIRNNTPVEYLSEDSDVLF